MIKSDLTNYRQTYREWSNIRRRYPGVKIPIKVNEELVVRSTTIRIVKAFIDFMKSEVGPKEASVLNKLYVFKETAGKYNVQDACDALSYSKSAFHENLDKWVAEYNRSVGVYWLDKWDTSL